MVIYVSEYSNIVNAQRRTLSHEEKKTVILESATGKIDITAFWGLGDSNSKHRNLQVCIMPNYQQPTHSF